MRLGRNAAIGAKVHATLRSLIAHPPRPEDRARVWSLAWPMIVSNLSVPLLGLVDTAVLGHLPDPAYLAAVAVGTTIFGFLYWGFGFLRMGTTGLAAQLHGRAPSRDRDGALRLLLAQGCTLAAALGALVLLLAPLGVAVGLELLAPPPEVAEEARRYAAIRIFSAPTVLATYACTGFLVGLGDTRSVLVVVVTTNLANIVLDLILVLGLGLRTEGVAGATLAAELLGLALAAGFALRRLRAHRAPLDRAALLRPSAYGELLAVNGHLFLRTLVLLGAMAFFTAQGARQGETVLAANALLLNLLMVVAQGLDGFAHAAEALAGRAIGAGDRDGFLRVLRAAGRFSLLTGIAFAALYAVAGDAVVGLLTDLPAVAAAARAQLPWLAALPLLALWCFLFDGVFIGAMRTRAMRDTMVLAVLGVYLPLWWATRGLGNAGLWLAFDAFFLARGVALGRVLLREFEGWFPATDVPAPQPSPRFGGRG
jgi:MATE family multidrug resistance protein